MSNKYGTQCTGQRDRRGTWGTCVEHKDTGEEHREFVYNKGHLFRIHSTPGVTRKGEEYSAEARKLRKNAWSTNTQGEEHKAQIKMNKRNR